MIDQNAVIEAHSDAVWRTVYRLVNNREDALECYQETFLNALHASNRDEVRCWRTMLLQIATRRAMDKLRSRYRDKHIMTQLSEQSRRQSAVDAPDAQTLREELRDQVRRALATLVPQQAEAFWLRHMQQMKSDEIAESMGIEPGYVRVLIHRAATELRSLLDPIYGSDSISKERP